jgi:DNA-binding transcriptional MerR regulator
MTSETLLQIGEVAERVGLSLRTLRYYEEIGLLTPETRTEGGFRLYAEAQVDRVLLIKQMKPLGFTIQEMRELLDARDALHADDTSPADRERALEGLKAYAGAAAERMTQLREQLDRAEEFAQQLRRETRRRRRPSS